MSASTSYDQLVNVVRVMYTRNVTFISPLSDTFPSNASSSAASPRSSTVHWGGTTSVVGSYVTRIVASSLSSDSLLHHTSLRKPGNLTSHTFESASLMSTSAMARGTSLFSVKQAPARGLRGGHSCRYPRQIRPRPLPPKASRGHRGASHESEQGAGVVPPSLWARCRSNARTVPTASNSEPCHQQANGRRGRRATYQATAWF
eukprot:scaffold3586_cov404-Prasinococcus_capsulatus_cf.AAC.6